MTGRKWMAVTGALTFWLHVVPVAAQQQAGGSPAREISAGIGWIRSSTMGSREAALTTATGDRFRLFSTSSDFESAPEFHVRLGGRVARTLDAEVAASFSKRMLRTTITNDVEATATAASVSATELTIEGGVRVSPRRWWVGPRIRLFAAGGGGYLRQLYEGKTLVETGRVVYVGGGFVLPFHVQQGSTRSGRVGLRVDLRAVRFSGGIALDESARISPAVRASIFTTF